jgi:hypothetical protein
MKEGQAESEIIQHLAGRFFNLLGHFNSLDGAG